MRNKVIIALCFIFIGAVFCFIMEQRTDRRYDEYVFTPEPADADLVYIREEPTPSSEAEETPTVQERITVEEMLGEPTGSEGYEELPTGDYCELLDFNTFSDKELVLIETECDSYVSTNGIYSGELVTCCFYGKNEDGTIRVNVLGTDTYFDISIASE